MKNLFHKHFFHYFLIIFIALVSIGQILRLYFGFEDFHLFYIFQNHEEAKRLLSIPEYARHLNQYYFERPLWDLFGYNALGYNFFTLILSICVYLLYYRLIRYITKNTWIALASAVFLASAYYGIDSFTWSYNTGFDLMGALAPGIILFGMLFAYLRTRKIRYLFIAILLFFPLVYFFRARTFHFIVIIFLIFLLYARMSLKKKILFLFPFIGIALFLLQKNISRSPYIFHVAIDPISTVLVFFATLGNFFFPSDISEQLYAFFNLQKYISLDILV